MAEIGKKVYHFKELNSTNEYSKKLVKDAEQGTVVLADEQTNGKGRFGKNWYSPQGGLWLSIILKPKKISGLISILGGLSVCETLRNFGIECYTKWPNDVVVGFKKIAGILTEVEEKAVILGIGINLNIPEFPVELKDKATSCLLEQGKTLKKDEVSQKLFNKIEEYYNTFETNSLDLLNKYRKSSITIGKLVEVITPSEILEGKVLDIAEDGTLVLRLSSGETKRLLAGECSLK